MTKALTATAAVAFAASMASAQIVIDFDAFEFDNLDTNDVGFSISEDGFTLTNPNINPFAVFGQDEPRYPGSASVFNNTVDGLIHLEADDGSAFDLVSIALAPLNNPVPVSVTFEGFLDGVSTGTQTFTHSGNAISLETFNFAPNIFSNVDVVEWTQASPFHQFDQITIVPAPGALALLGLGGLASLRRRR